MFHQYFFGALTRISDLQSRPFEVRPLPKERWADGDYVVGEVIPPLHPHSEVELTDGRMAKILEGDAVVGAIGVRRATLELVGDWQSIGPDGVMEDMTEAGFFGRVTSISFLEPRPTSHVYRGHVMRDGRKVCMKDFVPKLPERPYECPTVAIIGTSMSAGKTTAARIVVHQLKGMRLKVVGAKFTGAGRYRDILAMGDAGADRILDFIDVGLPSSVCPREQFRVSVRQLLGMIAAEEPDVVVAEVGASPFEPYNGDVVLEEMGDQIRCTVLCASDPYSVVGVSQSFGLTPDLVSGIAASTDSGVKLVEKLAGVKALTLPNPQSLSELVQLLKEKLAL